MKNVVKIISIIILLICILASFSPWVRLSIAFIVSDTISSLTMLSPDPEITYAEFPFRIVLEHNGERIVKEDTIVCEYDGAKYISGLGYKVRQWKVKLKSDNEFRESLYSIKLFDGVGYNVYYRPHSVKYLMDDLKDGVTYPNSEVTIASYIIENGVDTTKMTQNERSDYFNIKIISIEETPPITNTFK